MTPLILLAILYVFFWLVFFRIDLEYCGDISNKELTVRFFGAILWPITLAIAIGIVIGKRLR